MELPSAIESVCLRPGLYVQSETFDCVVSYVSGYDAALAGGLLVGFREWLIVRADGANNLAWPALVLSVLGDPGGKGNTDQLLRGLFNLLKEFWAARHAADGLRRIYAKYEAWLHTQEWYTPKSPHWL